MWLAKYKKEKRKRGIFLLFLILYLWSFSSTPAYSIMLRMDNSELIARSDLVIYGEVKEIHSKGDNREAIIFVECILKGKPTAGAEIKVIFSPGMEDSPVFETNERVLLFLTKSDSELFMTVGGIQGKFSFGKSQ
ncbi:MAG: hypothetical protein DWB56_00880 [Candidatus Jettenia sp.]|uniref:Uncharacterized protein n=2 Tax=Candidatus Jettenia TaxID=360731 RepID=I3IJ80_9BACT|nr:MAG: hypothetical protein EDM77_07740 [Candidatus Jettenia sp. AMX1]MBC6927507.1 hypothetical protein [Candidatus Jettenia sp.]GAB61775.1 hypothetical protein KSU1_C0179 [Candidatus Jettenia caeni]MCE7879189.1 hypothetical protein [Candidatus Jettenia sp. AMX1]MCQ3925692.1 hypothetical protein [Candidatus Jettenia sp.]